MAYTVLARKYRSRNFDELVGQDAVVTTLRNAITSGRVHHGYLLTGTRGVGKTSTARILAKALNCLASDSPTITPCGECDSCLAIASGDDIDVIEIDAASNTGVEGIRDLRSNANYRPARSRFKIYIIDEVHMLSTGAFNALLKTLEEPPGHVKFILATTDPQKVPATVQSRVQRFDFKSIGVGDIVGELQRILSAEGVEADEVVLRRIARLAAGSMRDALSLLDQLLSIGAGTLSSELIDEILPSPHDEKLSDLIDQLAARDPAGALVAFDRALEGGHTLERFCEAMVEQLRALMLLAVCGADTDLVDIPAAAQTRWVEQSQRFDAQTFVYMIAVLEDLRRQVRFSGTGRALADAAIVRLASMQLYSSLDRLLDQTGSDTTMSNPATSAPSAGRTEKKKSPPSDADIQPSVAVKARDPQPAPPVRASSAEASPPAPARVRGRGSVTQEERRIATHDPVVRHVLQRFDAVPINIERIVGGTEAETTDASPDD